MRQSHAGRLLIIDGPRLGNGSGLEIAVNDLVEQLRLRGWQVDLASNLLGRPPLGGRSRLAAFQRWHTLSDRWQRVPGEWRRLASALARSQQYIRAASCYLADIERLLAGPQPYDRVLLCVDHQPPGTTALVLAHAPGAALLSLYTLGCELGDRWWPLLRCLRCRQNTHPYLYQQVAVSQIRLAVFASAGWRDAALAAGLPAPAAHVIPFGLPLPPALPRPALSGRRLLWVGRLSREKGLHVVLAALPAICAALPDVTLTAIAGDGPVAYRRAIDGQIRRAGLTGVVRLGGPVPRAELQAVYASHDLLFFHSLFADPVALVLMEAFAAGLPVLANRVAPGALLVRHDETCLCYSPDDPASLAGTALRLLREPALAHRLSVRAQQLVRAGFTLEAMGAAYDQVLRRGAP